MSFLRGFVEVFENIESVFVGHSAGDASEKWSQLGQTTMKMRERVKQIAGLPVNFANTCTIIIIPDSHYSMTIIVVQMLS